MNNLKLLILLAALLCSPSGITKAQNFECRPLTCTLKDAGDYKVELAGCCNTLDIYVYDKALKPVRGLLISGYAEFFYNSDPPLQAQLTQYHLSNALSAKILAPQFNYCRVTLTIENRVVSVYFDNECELRAKADQGSDQPGKDIPHKRH